MKYLKLIFLLCFYFQSYGQMVEGTAETYHSGSQSIKTYFNNGQYELRDINNWLKVKSTNSDPFSAFNLNDFEKKTDIDNNWEQKNTLEYILIDNLNIDGNNLYFKIYNNNEEIFDSRENNNSISINNNQIFQFSGIQTNFSTLSVTFFYNNGFLNLNSQVTSFNLITTNYNATNLVQDGISIKYKFRLEKNFATDIFYGLQSTATFFNFKFNRTSDFSYLHNLNAFIYSGLVNDIYTSNALTNPTQSKMIFGAGVDNYRKPFTSLEVVAHEYMHLVLAKENKVIHPGVETRAINESICDAFGVIINYFYNKIENPNAEINWIINDFGLGSNPNDIQRDMSYPSNDFMEHNGLGESDNRQTNTYGFVPDSYIDGSDILQGPNWVDEYYDLGEKASYKNMGPANFWFYLIANEDHIINPKISVNDAGTNYSVKSIGIEKAQQLLYYLITDSPDLKLNSNYYDYASATINAAIHFENLGLHNFSQADVLSLRDAWHAVGVEFCVSGAIVSDSSGTIQDGSLNQDYYNNQNCSWIIQPTGAASVTIDFTSFNLGNGDTVTVYDGVDNTSVLGGPYTGSSLPSPLTSLTGAVYIEFFTDTSDVAEGWSLNYTSTVANEYCNSVTELFDPSAVFDDGSGNDSYVNNSNCSWRIAPENASYIDIDFLSFDLEIGEDFVSIYDGLNAESGTLLGTFTGSNLPNSLTASTGQAFIKFTSNQINVQQGWEINYTSDGIQPCSGTTTLNALSGSVSDGSSTDDYVNNANCSWLIQPTNATSITLIFDELNLQEPSLDGFSIFDYLEIYDGNDDSGEPMVTYTGNQFLPIIVQSSGGSLFVKFVSNSSITDSGWQFTYTSSTTDYCSGTTVLDTASGTISDNSGSNNYNSNSDCRWLIQPENATSIKLNFTAFDTEIGKDGVVVYDGPDTSFPYTAYSGSNLPNTIYSSGGAMLVRFLSDAQNEFQGFEANYISNIAPEGNPNSIVSYQYWFNDDYANVTSSSNFGAVNTLNLNIQSNTSNLSNGPNTLHIRTKDVLGFWSSVLSEYVYVQNTNSSGSSNNVVEYEYWFDNDYNSKVTGNGGGTNPLILNLNANVNTLEKGLHQFHIRFKDGKGSWSSIVSEFIYNNKPEGLGDNAISAYRYWFNDDFDNRVSETVGLEANYMFLEDINISGLTNSSTNYIHFQFKDIYNYWSSVLTEEFLFETLSINEPNAERLKLYPNPTNSIIYITTKVEDGELTIYDNLGKLIQEFDTIPNQIDISNYESGLYLFQIKSENKVYQEKVIKF